jgi:hypothetical protein
MGSSVRLVVLIAVAVFLAAGSWAFLERSSYHRAVREDALRRGFDPAAVRFPEQWPLEYYEPFLRHNPDPEDAETVVTGADSVEYYLDGFDNTLIQVFHFQLGRWPGQVAVRYDGDQTGSLYNYVDAGEQLPDSVPPTAREHALAWYRERRAGTAPFAAGGHVRTALPLDTLAVHARRPDVPR